MLQRKTDDDQSPRSPDELLLRRIKLHRENIKAGFDPLFQNEMIARCQDQLQQLKSAEWSLEAMEQCDPLKRSLTSLGLGERACNALERYGVIWSGELCQWTEAMLLLVPNFGAKAIHEIRYALAEARLHLREPAEGEEAILPAMRFDAEEARKKERASHRKLPAETARRLRGVILMLAEGRTEAEVNERYAVPTGYRIAKYAKDRIRARLLAGECPRALARWLGFRFGQAGYKSAVEYFEAFLGKSRPTN